uniref:At1g23510 n=1 Tax=Arabidopsis thaliana TaxID=3702 RepID=Q6NLU7_ARATH|nr:At1g23510 [Arabidopsis thaliana]AAS76719.1 At1g23510 [Arabidopsis thaliana]
MGVFPGFGSWINQNTQQLPHKVSFISINYTTRELKTNKQSIDNDYVCCCRQSPRDLRMRNLSQSQRQTLMRREMK